MYNTWLAEVLKSLKFYHFGCSSDVNAVSVMIDGAECIVGGVINSMIECVTGPHAGSVVAMVEVQISGNGIAQEVSRCFLLISFLLIVVRN
ncbi:hypothetical protein DPMN_079575 [Dreissena polymorpha]|uniref:IPT/TIG domain-containing protein n=1 Tax=Dreissena polymorpha TaxID=45954 RepID=A0A9D3YPA4_DREPO|nr:hypothetical protein DPMN_079575 [Dreissena polymorpha]